MDSSRVCFNCAFQYEELISGVCEDCHREFFDEYAKITLCFPAHFGEFNVRYSLEDWEHENKISHIEWNYGNHKTIHDLAYANYLDWDKNKGLQS